MTLGNGSEAPGGTLAGIARIAESHAALGRLPAPQLPDFPGVCNTSSSVVFELLKRSCCRGVGLFHSLRRGMRKSEPL